MFKVTKFILAPDPIRIPGELFISLAFNLAKTVYAPMKVWLQTKNIMIIVRDDMKGAYSDTCMKINKASILTQSYMRYDS